MYLHNINPPKQNKELNILGNKKERTKGKDNKQIPRSDNKKLTRLLLDNKLE